MEPRRTSDGIVVGGDARQRLHDARGYGYPVDADTIRLTRVEAAHLLHRGDLSHVDGMAFEEFVRAEADEGFPIRLAVYQDLRDRGFYLDPCDRPGVPRPAESADFVVYERGAGRSSDSIVFAVCAMGEHATIGVERLEPMVFGIVDDEGEVGYIEFDNTTITGTVSPPDGTDISATVLGDRVYLWDATSALYRRWFFGRPLAGREFDEDVLVVSLLEATYLADRGVIAGGSDAIRQQGRSLDGDRFDRLLRVYAALREAGGVPKTGYKFGTDFRVYREFETIDEMGHSDKLIRVLPPDATIHPPMISLDVRLAHGVGKRMVFAITGGSDDTALTWLSVTRLTP